MLDEAQAASLPVDWALFAFGFRPTFGVAFAHQLASRYVLFEVTDPNGAVVYVPALARKRAMLATLRFLHVPADARGLPLDAESEALCMEAVLRHVRSHALADRIPAPFNWCVFRGVPQGATSARFGSYVLDLQKPVEQLWKDLHAKHRNGIRNAGARGAQVRQGPDQLATFHRLYQATMARNGMQAEPLAFFEALVAAQPDSMLCAVVYHGDAPQGPCWCPGARPAASTSTGPRPTRSRPPGRSISFTTRPSCG
ncbi:peptidoglycan bridge formation glycyltransferase FemA/FemB family protein [Ramlibacter terrae]|uniref:Peptidoglycan bridge formation glycyltransferase FemA/FemB family protein n=1 Tax=Ramlibacter terrae TaxID=2732511 RepID=A0ABX6P3J2_9BURK|nr:peptidoglycan bridge formation glycyltransferase FemA/FemB family protein [Ramlibacter terrae]